MQIGFIGLGAMGGGIARRLARRGFSVVGCDVSAQALAAFDEPNAEREADPIAAARRADVLGVCVRTDAQLEALVAQGALFEALGSGGIFILNSTVAPDLARRLAKDAAAYGVEFIDVGVSGGVPAAEAGTLSLFIGGSGETVARAQPILDAMGTVTHLGDVGRGLEGKLLNNLVAIANFGTAAAIFDLAREMGFDQEVLRQALKRGSANAFSLDVIPTLLDWNKTGKAEYFERTQDLLAKDVHHAETLLPADKPALHALVAASQFMLDELARVARQDA